MMHSCRGQCKRLSWPTATLIRDIRSRALPAWRHSTFIKRRDWPVAAQLAPYWEDAIHSLKGLPHVIDLRNIGLLGGIELEPRRDQPTVRGYEVFVKCYENGVLTRGTGDTIILSPPLIIDKRQIDQLISTIAEALKSVE